LLLRKAWNAWSRIRSIWQKYGFDDVKAIGFGGDAKLQQAMYSGDVDFGVGGGPVIAFFAKGVPAKAIAAETYAPRTLSIMTVNRSGISSAADLKGKKIGISTAGSLSEWLAKRFAMAQGWGPDGITVVALGGLDSNLAALKTHEVDAILTATAVGFQFEEKMRGETS
jgi:NitT/TauT family transport system substrate-binding protein